MSSIDLQYWSDLTRQVKASTDPVFFIENFINVAGFPLLLRPRVAEFVYRLYREQEVTDHDLARGEGMTTGILGYIVWKAHNRPGTTHILSSGSMVDTMERLIHVAAMARSVSWEGEGFVKKTGADVELQNGSKIMGLSARSPVSLIDLRADTFVCDGFGDLTEAQQAQLACRVSYISGKCQTIIV